jgi:hypothetical protein
LATTVFASCADAVHTTSAAREIAASTCFFMVSPALSCRALYPVARCGSWSAAHAVGVVSGRQDRGGCTIGPIASGCAIGAVRASAVALSVGISRYGNAGAAEDVCDLDFRYFVSRPW